MKKLFIASLVLSSVFLLFGDICNQCDEAYGHYWMASSSHTGPIWHDTTHIFANTTQVIVQSNNPFGSSSTPRFTFYSSYESKQTFDLEPVLEFGWCSGSENQAHRSYLTVTEFRIPNDQAGLNSILDSDNVPVNFRSGLNGNYVYRIVIVAPDSGYGAVSRLSYNTKPHYAFGLAWVIHYRTTFDRASICVQKNFCTFGPENQPLIFARKKGKPEAELVQWESCGGSGKIVVNNRTLSSAYILLNGKEIFSPRDFNQQVKTLELDIDLVEGLNSLEVMVKGKPGEFLEIQFTES